MQYSILCALAFSVVLHASGCEKSPYTFTPGAAEADEASINEVANNAEPLASSFCGDLVAICPKLWRLVQEYPPRLTDQPLSKDLLFKPEVASYVLDSLVREGQYIHNFPIACPGLTREHIVCAIGEPRRPRTGSPPYNTYKGKDELIRDAYIFTRDMSYGEGPNPYWREPFYTVSFFYGYGDTLAFVNHNGI